MAEKRKVFHFSIVHTKEEVSGDATALMLGRQLDDQSTIPVWEAIGEFLKEQTLNYRLVRIYHDGLPISSEKDPKSGVPVERLGAPGPNNDMVASLISKGAILKGTENDALLNQTYYHVDQSKEAAFAGDWDKYRYHVDQGGLLRPLRDRAIAHRIRHTLGVGETGILFLGLGHNIEEYGKGLRIITPQIVVETARRVIGRIRGELV